MCFGILSSNLSAFISPQVSSYKLIEKNLRNTLSNSPFSFVSLNVLKTNFISHRNASIFNYSLTNVWFVDCFYIFNKCNISIAKLSFSYTDKRVNVQITLNALVTRHIFKAEA